MSETRAATQAELTRLMEQGLPDLLDFVRVLSARDSKSLTGKALKTAEEVGELAKVALPYDSAAGTRHRFVQKEKILEECVDTTLCALSIVFSLGYTLSDFIEMMERKAVKWSGLQEDEAGAEFPLPYEIHITVHNPDLDAFRAACADLGVKPIVLDLQDKSGGSVVGDVMTSSKAFGDNATAYEEVRRIADGLKARGFAVVREKVETVPWHPAAPRWRDGRAASIMPQNCYFECHFGVMTTRERMDDLTVIAKGLDCHRSRNVFKAHEDGTVTVMMTRRVYEGTYESFKDEVARIEAMMGRMGFPLDRVVVEFSIYDTKVGHDAAWLRATAQPV